VSNPAGLVLRGLIRFYQLVISPVLPASCRFYPTCSAYALEAVTKHGPVAGSWLAVRRVCRCHPWNDGGIDPVPDPKKTAGRALACRHPD
jgi:putative membrane protein insertion efficiency factor